MVDATFVVNLIEAIGILVGVTIAIIEIRKSREERQKETIFLRFQSFDRSYDFARVDTMDQEWGTTMEEYRAHSPKSRANFNYLQNRYNTLGVLLKNKMIDPDLLYQIITPRQIMRFWEIIEKIIMDYRISTNDTTFIEGFEYLYNDAKRRFPDINTRRV